MNNRTGLLVSLLVLGLILIGGGIWWKFDSSSGNTIFYPIISMEVTNNNASSHNNLYIDKDGAVICIEIGDARPDLGRQGFKIWKKGQLGKEEFESLVKLFKDNNNSLKESYQGGVDGTPQSGDMDAILSINYEGMAKTIIATRYLSPYSSYSYPDSEYAGMPAPLDRICKRLGEIAANTVEYSRE